jgi:iron-sulfur cluster repair protein YtfE (RIC family)
VLELELPDFCSPPGGFGRPLAIVQACHERLRRMVEMLVPLREHLREHGADHRAVVSAATIRTHLEHAWPRHLQDEEVDIFPCLRARLRDRHTVWARNVAEAIQIVSDQHRAFVPLSERVVALLRRIEPGSTQHLDDPQVQAFVELFRSHLALEEEVLGPAYARLLTAADLQQIGTAMAQRRNVAWPTGANPA